MAGTLTESTKLYRVSQMADGLVGSEIIRMSGEIRERIAQGASIFNFTIGDFDPEVFPLPDALKEAIIEAYRQNATNYPASNGMPELRQAISRLLHTRGQLEYNEEQILVAGGSRPLIYATYQTLLDPEDAVVFPVPSWNNNHYSHLAHCQGIPVKTTPDNHFLPTAENLKPHIQQATLVALCSPLNPTGTIFDKARLDEICSLILEENHKRGEARKPVYLLYDQVYWQLIHGDDMHHDPVTLQPEMKDYTIFIDGLSKAFSATGVRVGWAFGPQKIIQKMRSILGHIGAWAPKAEQVACARFLQQDDAMDAYLQTFKGQLHKRLLAFYDGFQALRKDGWKVDAIYPQASIYLTVQLNLLDRTAPNGKRLSNTEAINQYLLHEAGIALVPFYAFGAPRNSTWFRLSVGTVRMDMVERFFERLREALERLT